MGSRFPWDRLLSTEEYFASEDASPVRHEYVHGRLHVMNGATRRHSRITMNIAGRLWTTARGGPCRVHPGDVMLRANDAVYYYPDVMVACGPEPREPRIEDAPSVVFEVLSPSTERVDRGEKMLVYRQIPSLVEYVIVEQDRRCVERYYRVGQDQWRHDMLVEHGRIELARPAVILTLEEIYESVELPSPEEWLRQLRLREEAAAYG